MIQIKTKFSKEFRRYYPAVTTWMVGNKLHGIQSRTHEIQESTLDQYKYTERGGVKVLDVKVLTDKKPVIKEEKTNG